jgi:hypothetical protein
MGLSGPMSVRTVGLYVQCCIDENPYLLLQFRHTCYNLRNLWPKTYTDVNDQYVKLKQLYKVYHYSEF